MHGTHKAAKPNTRAMSCWLVLATLLLGCKIEIHRGPPATESSAPPAPEAPSAPAPEARATDCDVPRENESYDAYRARCEGDASRAGEPVMPTPPAPPMRQAP